jgi:fumarate reductase subunit D
MAKSNEPIVWSLFSAGGVLTALAAPVLIVLLGFAIPQGWTTLDFDHVDGFNRVNALVGHPLTKLFVVALVCLGLFHWAHRFRFTLIDIGLHSLETLITVLCYGAAIVGTGVAVYVVWL